MQAIAYDRYGPPDVLAPREVDEPVPGDSDVLVRVHAAGVGAGDWHLLSGSMLAVRLYQGLFRPKRPILGHDVSGVVEAVGARVTAFRPGDEVFGESLDAGGFAELARVHEHGLARKPAGVTHAEAAAVPSSAATALQGLRVHGRLRAGHEVLVNGASGGVGTFAVQIAKADGARVTGVCSASKADLVRSLGADRVLDHARDDFTRRDERYDVVLDLSGRRPLADCRRVLTPEGTYVAVAGPPLRTLRAALFGGRQVTAFIAKPTRADLETLAGMLDDGTLRAVVERTHPLEGVPDALRDLGEGRVRGKRVIAVLPPQQP